jgi:hypothetical protein
VIKEAERLNIYIEGNGDVSRPVIVIDGLDYDFQENGFSILELLGRYKDYLHKVARFIITANATPADTTPANARSRTADEYIRDKLATHPGKQIVEILGSPLTFVGGPLIPMLLMTGPISAWGTSLIPMLGRSPISAGPSPLPMYVQFKDRIGESLEDLLGKDAVKKLDEAASSPRGLDAIYNAYLEYILKQSPEQQAKIYKLLKVLAAAYEPLKQDVIARIIGLSPGEEKEEMVEMVKKIRPFLWPSATDGGLLVMDHDSMREFVLDRYLSEKDDWHYWDSWEDDWHWEEDHDSMREFVLDSRGRAAAHELFVKAYRPPEGNWTGITDWSKLLELEDEEDEEDASRYARRHLANHAYECYQATEPRCEKARHRADDFLNLVCAPGFRTVRLVEMGLQTALQDVRRGLRVAFVEYGLFDSDVEEVPQALEAFDQWLAAMSADDDLPLIALEKQLRREEGGVPELLEFLGPLLR